MNITNQQNNINFGTNIKLVSPSDFKKIKQSFYNPLYMNNYIYDFLILKNSKNSNQCYRLNKTRVITENLRTCVGIVAADTENKKSSFFAHFYHSMENLRNLNLVKKYIKGNNAVIIGQRRDNYGASPEIFNELQRHCSQNKMQYTILRGIRYGYEADYAYSGKKDTLYLCVSKIDDKSKYADNLRNLKYIFRNVYFAPCDNIEFIEQNSFAKENKILSFFKLLFNL